MTDWSRRVERASPVAAAVPEAIRLARKGWGFADTGDYARFRIEIVAGDGQQRQKMFDEVARTVGGKPERSWPASRADAVEDAALFAMQDEYLPLVKRALEGGDEMAAQYARHAIAMRPSARAMDVLLAMDPETVTAAAHYLHGDNAPRLFGRFIEWLVHDDDRVRALAEFNLQKWAGTSFGRDWRGWRVGRPTLEEGRAMQPRWRAWWQNNRDGFRVK